MENKLLEKRMASQDNGAKANKNIIRVIKGSILAIIMTIILLTIYATILTHTNVSENSMIPVVITISGISILMGSSLSSLKIRKQGMLNGALVGLIYMLVLYLISSMLLTGFSINMNSIIMIIVGTIAGIIGGVIGVNL